jgi:hypothetical protein
VAADQRTPPAHDDAAGPNEQEVRREAERQIDERAGADVGATLNPDRRERRRAAPRPRIMGERRIVQALVFGRAGDAAGIAGIFGQRVERRVERRDL